MAPAGGARLYARRYGSTNARHSIVVVHGGPNFNMSYLLSGPGGGMAALAPALAKPGVPATEVVLYDQRACGRSTNAWPADSFRLRVFARDLDSLRAALGREKLHLIGHSFGGLIVLEYARRYPHRVASLVLLCAAPVASDFGGAITAYRRARWRPADVAALAAARRHPDFADSARRPLAWARYYTAGFRRSVARPNVLDSLGLWLPASHEASATLHRPLGLDQRAWDYRPTLRRLAAPVLALQGAHDMLPLGPARAAAQSARARGRFVALLRSGHFPYLEAPEELWGVLVPWYGEALRNP